MTLMLNIIFLASFSQAQDSEDLFRVQSLNELMDFKQSNEIKELKIQCSLSLSQKKFPIPCFQYMEEVLARPQSKEKIQSLRKKINFLCLQSAIELQSLEVIDQALKIPYLDSACKQSLSRQKQDLIYIQNS